ncbi:MAG: phosphoenolpyruvate synthase [Nitrososphaeria archaeon]
MSTDRNKRFVLWFEETSKNDTSIVGGKAANLGEMISAGIPVPPGFTITATAYRYFIQKTGIEEKIRQVLEGVDYNDQVQLTEKAGEIRQLFKSAETPRDLQNVTYNAYNDLSERLRTVDANVAVRSSATAEDLPGASFAGQQETYLNVRGRQTFLESVKNCWGSLFTPRATFYRHEKGFDHMQVALSVAVQKMVNAKCAGVIFTLHPTTGDRSKIVIEGNWGLGESVVSGSVTPDTFVIDKQSKNVLERKIAKKVVEYVRDPNTGKTIHRQVPDARQGVACLTDEEIARLTELAMRIEEHYGSAQDIEWSIDRDLPFPQNVLIVQSRPETVWSVKEERAEEAVQAPAQPTPVTTEKKVAVKGLPASPGAAAGTAKVIPDASQIGRVKEKDILVTKMTAPDWVPAMRKASAIVTDEGGMTCHAAIVSRELGVPCIVGTGNATTSIKDGNSYTVDATTGTVYEGIVADLVPTTPEKAAEAVRIIQPFAAPTTGTKIYMNLGIPEKIHDYADLPFDGIGLMRVEFIMASYIGEHPNYLIEIGQEQKFIDKMAEGMATVARAIQPRPVVVRFSDFKTNEYRELKGGEKYEPQEGNPMMGWRGVSRYISKEYEKAFRLECRAMKKVREEWGLKNAWAMLPFVRTTWEVDKCLRIMEEEGLERGRDFKVWLMAEVPSIIFMAEEFSKKCDGFSIGSNDLTQLILGTDRDSAILPNIDARYFDERDPAVKSAVRRLIEIAHREGVTCSICGQGPSVYEEFAAFLVECGIDSLSVNPDTVAATRRSIASVERKMLLKRLTQGHRQD